MSEATRRQRCRSPESWARDRGTGPGTPRRTRGSRGASRIYRFRRARRSGRDSYAHTAFTRTFVSGIGNRGKTSLASHRDQKPGSADTIAARSPARPAKDARNSSPAAVSCSRTGQANRPSLSVITVANSRSAGLNQMVSRRTSLPAASRNINATYPARSALADAAIGTSSVKAAPGVAGNSRRFGAKVPPAFGLRSAVSPTPPQDVGGTSGPASSPAPKRMTPATAFASPSQTQLPSVGADADHHPGRALRHRARQV